MKRSQFELASPGHSPLFAQIWQPDGDPRGVVCLVHGLGEHSGRYQHVAEFLTQGGFTLLAIDLRGHGKTPGPRGHASNLDELLDDIESMLNEASRRFPGKPRFLYGHSLGATLALSYVLRRKPDLCGVVVSGPGLRTSLTEQTMKVLMIKALGSLLPKMSIPTGLNPQTICNDPAVVQAYVNDPLVHNRTSLALARASIGELDWLFAHAAEFHLPLLIQQGSSDRLIYPQGAREFAALVKGGCTLKLWEGLGHEVHNEPGKEQVLGFMLQWLVERVSEPA
ncbi:MAG: lysophospholipase [Anaerolineales bacterium]|nr:lysophospholipase [Anaerolineales bacterium]